MGIIPQGIQRFDIIHLSFAAFCSIALLPVALSSLLSRGRESRLVLPVNLFSVAATAGALLAVASLSPAIQRMYHHTTRLLSAPVAVKGRQIPLGSPSLIQEISMIGRFMEMYSQPGERLFVGPSDLRRTAFGDVYLYHLFPWLTPGSYFMEMNPLSANREGSRLPDDLAKCDWLILNRIYEGWREPNASEWLGPDTPNEVVRRRFTLKAEIGSFQIFQRNSAEQRNPAVPSEYEESTGPRSSAVDQQSPLALKPEGVLAGNEK